jgi:hypothetical protein
VSCVSRVDSLSAIIANYSTFCESLIKNEGKSSGDTKSKASGHRRMLEDPEFLIEITVPPRHLCKSFIKNNYRIFSEAIASLVSMVVLALLDESQNTLNMLK